MPGLGVCGWLWCVKALEGVDKVGWDSFLKKKKKKLGGIVYQKKIEKFIKKNVGWDIFFFFFFLRREFVLEAKRL